MRAGQQDTLTQAFTAASKDNYYSTISKTLCIITGNYSALILAIAFDEFAVGK